MPRSAAWFAGLVISLLAPACVLAADSSSGVDPGSPGPSAGSQSNLISCRVLWFGGDSGFEVQRLVALGATVTASTDPAVLNPVQPGSYDVVVLSFVPPGTIGSARGAIADFVMAGGGLLIHQPNAVGTTDYTPPGFDAAISDIYWCGHNNGNVNDRSDIVASSHPIMAGLSNASPSGDFDTVSSLGPGYQVLAVNHVCRTASVAAGELGAGHIVFETGNLSPECFVPGSDAYWQNLFTWLRTSSPVPARRGSWGQLKEEYR
jgi:hypothetical protein